jgi:hypothetical protein
VGAVENETIEPEQGFSPWDVVNQIVGVDTEVTVEPTSGTPILVSVSRQPAAEWLQAMCREEWARVEYLTDPMTQSALLAGTMAGRITNGGLVAAWRDLVEAVTGRRWFEAYNLAMVALVSWHGEFGGRMILAGVDATRVSFGSWLDAVYALMVKDRDEKARRDIDVRLRVRPVSVEDGEEAMDEDAFREAMGSI